MKSPGHRQNILNCACRNIGIDHARSTDPFAHYWTQVLGAQP